MIDFEEILLTKPNYLKLLGRVQAVNILSLFAEIEKGKYARNEIHSFTLNNLKHPIYLRAIRADMQSFVNTFIDPYLEKKHYLSHTEYVIDAGANIGFTAILFANWWPNSKIVSIEPDTENYQLTLKNTSAYSNIKVLHGALWNKSAQLTIEAGQEDGFVVREINHQTTVKSENLANGLSLSDIMTNHNFPRIDFLKMNIEGSEKEVFSTNYELWLPKTRCMLIELHDGKNAGCSKTVFATTNNYHFAVAETAPYGVLFVDEAEYRAWYAKWYREEIYTPNIDKNRFPEFYLDKE